VCYCFCITIQLFVFHLHVHGVTASTVFTQYLLLLATNVSLKCFASSLTSFLFQSYRRLGHVSQNDRLYMYINVASLRH